MLKTVAKHHKEWIEVVQKLGGGYYSEDIVQEMYIKLLKYATYDKVINKQGVNRYYIYLTLKSILYTYFREQKKMIKFNIDDFEIEDNEDTLQTEQNFHEFCLKVDKESETWHWYDKQIFDIYKNKKTSFRKIANDTGISWVSIFHTVKNCKSKIKNKLKDDYEKIRQTN